MEALEKLKAGMQGKTIKPVTKQDKKLAKKHLKATIKFENKKAKQHLTIAKTTKSKQSKKYNNSHAQKHLKHAEQQKQMLQGGTYV